MEEKRAQEGMSNNLFFLLRKFESPNEKSGEVETELPLDTCSDFKGLGGSRKELDNWCNNDFPNEQKLTVGWSRARLF